MPSATTAHNSDSMAASNAIVTAGWNRCWMLSQDNAGMWGLGRPCGMPPNRLPIVSTGKLQNATAAVPRTKAAIEPGTRLCHDLGQNKITANDAAASDTVGH